MKFLLDVNVLLAWEHPMAQGHGSFHAWRAAHPSDELLSCAVTELGFIRVSVQVFSYSVVQAQEALAKRLRPYVRYLADLPAPALPASVRGGSRTTDGYLAQVAQTHGASLATFDTGIPNVTLIAP